MSSQLVVCDRNKNKQTKTKSIENVQVEAKHVISVNPQAKSTGFKLTSLSVFCIDNKAN